MPMEFDVEKTNRHEAQVAAYKEFYGNPPADTKPAKRELTAVEQASGCIFLGAAYATGLWFVMEHISFLLGFMVLVGSCVGAFFWAVATGKLD